MAAVGEALYRLEFTAVTRKKSGGVTGYGFALLNVDTGHLVSTGCGPVKAHVSYNQAAHMALLEGLQVAHVEGAKRMLLQCDSSLVVKQLQKFNLSTLCNQPTSPLVAAMSLMAQLQDVKVEKLDRWENGLAIIQAEFATELLLQLSTVARAAPSKYATLARQLGLLLQLPMSMQRTLEAADNFADTVAEGVATRCGADKQRVVDTLLNFQQDSSEGAAAASSADIAAALLAATATPVEQLAHKMVQFGMKRVYTPQEGAAYAEATNIATAAQSQSTEEQGNAAIASNAAEQQLAAVGLTTPPIAQGPTRLSGGRVVGRHRLTHRYLVVGLHKLPADWEPCLPQQAMQHATQQHSKSGNKWSISMSVPAESRTAAVSGRTAVVEGETAASAAASAAWGHQSEQLPWLPGRSAASGSEGVGLGEHRYELPHVSSDTATHLLQFDGASRNNPGRGGYGYVVFDLTSGQLLARGCMSLPYGQSASRAEFEGLLAGLKAALAAGVRHLAVQGDSSAVLEAVMFRRGIATKEMSVAYQKAAKLLACFDHVDFQLVPREQNSLADRLASMSMDIDTALYALLRKDERGVAGLTALTKAARINKQQRTLELLVEMYSLPLLLVVLLQRVMAISPGQLLERLQDKAARLGDPNPWLVQEVRKLVQEGIPDHVMVHVGAAIMDSRYRSAACLKKHAGLLQQQQQLVSSQLQQLRRYSHLYSHVSTAAANVLARPQHYRVTPAGPVWPWLPATHNKQLSIGLQTSAFCYSSYSRWYHSSRNAASSCDFRNQPATCSSSCSPSCWPGGDSTCSSRACMKRQQGGAHKVEHACDASSQSFAALRCCWPAQVCSSSQGAMQLIFRCLRRAK